ncbi:glycerol-3-phosphate acyltransferase 1, mitochondrial-like [Littorina saxatilis]|uniref:Phospholipid/glycerol acyltransferase domain-containing protein n=1 Tax=Littorina saxatilis TaxID=31220 RepID=A0AAN9BQM5_9CAEN
MPAEFSSYAGCRSGPQFGRRNPRRKQTTFSVEDQYDTNMLASFKSSPSFKPEDFKVRRPLMGQCCRCMPVSRDDIVEPGAAELGVRNILDVKPELRSKSVLATTFSELAYTMRRPLFGPFPDLSMAVLTNRRVVEAIQKTARDLDAEHEGTDKLAVVEKRAAKIMKKMKASISTVFIKFTGWFLLKFLSLMLRGVLVQRGQMAVLKKTAERGMPMIYLPLHRSHLDYILVTFILWNYDIRAPYVAAGENMDIPFFSLLMRSLGGFFIRRRLDNGGQQKDIVYRSILNTYMLEMLKKGDSLEFFLEGGRTRTGRAVIPKGGLLSVVTEACTEGIIPDAYIVPMTISYDKLLEGHFCSEQMGRQKKKESFVGACRAILKILFGDFGSVRIDFAQPFSVQEFLKSAEQFPHPTLKYCYSRSDSSASGLNISQSSLSMLTNGSCAAGDTQDNTRVMVKALAEHTVYACVKTQAPMCSHCLAFLLLTKCRQGGTMSSLVQSLDWLKEQLFKRKQDVGFCGTSEDVILYAQCLLGDNVVQRSVSKEKELCLKPNMSLPAVFELSYHANTVTATFALESIVACAVVMGAGLRPSMWLANQQVSDNSTVTREAILDTAQHIADLMHNEFILVPPCRQIMDALIDTVEDFVSMEILLREDLQYDMNVDLVERRRAIHLSRTLEFDDEYDEDEEDMDGGYVEQQEYMVNVSVEDVRSKLQFLHVVLAPILESYLITACYITQSLEADMPEDDFLKKLGHYAQERAKNKLVMHMESCGVLTLKNAVKAFQNLRILDTYKEANLTMIGLTEHFGVRERLDRYVEILKVARN